MNQINRLFIKPIR